MRLLLAVTTALVVAAAPPLRADPTGDCQAGEALSPATVLAACAEQIASGRLNQHDLALAHNRRGIAYQRTRDYGPAVAEYEQAVKISPKYGTGYANLANAARLNGDIARAREAVQTGLRADSNNAFLYSARGLIATHDGAFQDAIADYNRALELKPDYSAAFFNRAEAYSSLGQLDRACADYDAAISADSRNSGAFAGRAFCRLERHDLEGAMSAANQAIELGPQNPGAYNARGRVYRAKRDFDRAVADFDAAIKLRPTFTSALINRGTTRRTMGQPQAAVDDFTAALRVDPTYTAAYTGRGLAYLDKGDIESGRKDLQTAVSTPPKYFYGRSAQETARSRLALLPPPGESRAVGSEPPPGAKAPEQIAITSGPGKSTDKRVALVIGNGTYAHVGRLPNPANDARAVAAAFRDLGFDVIEGIDLSRAAMDQSLRQFLQNAASARVALMFYAGHGMQVDGRNYLIPVDAKLENRTDLDFETVDLDRILSALDDDVRANIIMLDACRDNPLAQRYAEKTKSRGLSSGSGLAAYSSVGTGTLIAFATAPGHVAQDGDGANSPFTSALLKHMKSSNLEVRQLMTRVRADVAASTAKQQIPWDNSSLLGDVYLAGTN